MPLESITRSPGDARPTPLVFVHGAWHAAWCWDEHFLDYFADSGYWSTAVSLRGHGGSSNDRSLRTTRIRHYVEDLAGFVGKLEPAPVVIGHSMGGLVVQRLMEKVDLPAAVLVAPVPIGGASAATLRTARRHPLAYLKAHLTLSLWPIIGTPSLARDLLFAEDLSEAESDRYWSRLQDESYLAYWDMVIRRPKPGRVGTPVLVIGAGSDRLFALDEIRATAAAYGTEPVVIHGAGHDLMLDTRWQQGADAILDWLEERGL